MIVIPCRSFLDLYLKKIQLNNWDSRAIRQKFSFWGSILMRWTNILLNQMWMWMNRSAPCETNTSFGAWTDWNVRTETSIVMMMMIIIVVVKIVQIIKSPLSKDFCNSWSLSLEIKASEYSQISDNLASVNGYAAKLLKL